MEIIWQHRDEFPRIVLRMEAYHIACVFLAVIGKCFGETGLNDLVIEAGIVGSSSINGVIEGKYYNRSVHTHKIIMEALVRIQWRVFVSWLQKNYLELDLGPIEAVIKNIREELSPTAFHNLYTLSELCVLHCTFVEFTNSNDGKMFKF